MMKNKIWLLALMFLLIGLVSADINYDPIECKQNNITEANDCGGLGNGTYGNPSSVFFDGDWTNGSGQLGTTNFYPVMPIGFESMYLTVKHGDNGSEINKTAYASGGCLAKDGERMEWVYSGSVVGLTCINKYGWRTGYSSVTINTFPNSQYFVEKEITWLKFDYQSTTGDIICYQEAPETATTCGADGTGSSSTFEDNDWFTSHRIDTPSYFNYTIPDNTLNAVVKYKYERIDYQYFEQEPPIVNLDVADGCLDGDILQLYHVREGGNFYDNWYCYNYSSSAYVSIRTESPLPRAEYGSESAVVWEIKYIAPLPTYADTSLYK